ncbi:deoxyribonuclease IV [uncultured Selenomonas sp.]|uniref:deoxyribonuclease IV n=1 Tax=uncultured Selenomonas sp. TaxID=159275 RepID=UPI0028DD0558|nr:deoxyribonuclease IV [uncultured Selenomonas sp.]
MQKVNHTLHIGCHLSSAGGFLAMGKAAVKLDADVFAFFTRNPRGGRAKPLDLDDVRAFSSYREEHGIGTLVAHAPYTMNACAAKEGLRAFAREAMADDLARLENIPNTLYNFHPGSHVQQGTEKGIELIAELLNEVLSPSQKTLVLLETMAGKGTEIGRSFEELAAIIDRVNCKEKLGVCLDTCHIWDAGYDIVDDLDGVLDKFDRVIGLSHLHAIHLNDSLNVRAARKDRHARIGEGELGLQALTRVIRHPKLRHLPFILETPNDDAGYAREIAMLRECAD